jgi:fucose permease
MNRLGGSLIPAIMVHGLTNDAVGFSGLTVIERALTPDAQLTRAIPTLAFALVLILAGWREQGRTLQHRESE